MTKQNKDDAFSFEDESLLDIRISDEDLEQDDKTTKLAKKKSRKLSKAAMSPAENKRARNKRLITVAAITLAVLITTFTIPYSRWFVLNLLGVRSTTKFVITESGNKKPLSNASILLDGTYFTVTDEFGRAQLENVTLGKHQVTIQKNGYSKEQATILNDVKGSSSQFSIKSIGIKVNLDIRNWLTNEPIPGATVSLSKDAVTSDKNGRASIVVPPDSTNKTLLEIAAPAYRTQSVPISLTVESKEIALVSDAKTYFISKRAGKLDIFSSYVDGGNQQKLIEATGKEDLDLMQFSMHRANRFGILVSNRESKLVNGRVVAGIYVVDTTNASLRKIDEGSDVQLLEWGDDTLVYQKTSPTLNYDDPGFTKLVSFNPLTNRQKDLAQANYFSVSIVAQNKLFFAGADGYREEMNSQLQSVDLTSSAQKTYLDGRLPVSLSRANYDTLTLQANDNNYYSVAIKAGTTRQIDRRVDSLQRYVTSPNSQQTLWTEKRDGQGMLLARSTTKDDTRVVAKLSGVTNSVRYISDRYAVVRVVTTTETADYLVDIPTGKTIKVADVTDIRTVGTVL